MIRSVPAFIASYLFVYARVGLIFPYLMLYLRQQGYEVADVSRISFFVSLAAIVMQQVWGFVADVLLTRRLVIMIVIPLGVSAVASMTYVSSLGPAPHRFAMLCGLALLLGSTNSPVPQLLNGLTLGDPSASPHFSLLRAAGSASFILVNLILGNLTAKTSLALDAIWPLYACIGMSCVISVFFIPDRQRAIAAAQDAAEGVKSARPSFFSVQRVLLGNPSIRGVLVLVVLYETAFAMSFYIITPFFVRETLGLDNDFVSYTYTLAAFAEIPFILAGDRLIRRFGALRCLYFACIGNVLRWVIAYHSTSAWTFVPLSLLHSVTFGMFFFGVVRYIDRHTGPRIKASAQTLMGICYFGITHMLANTIAPYLLDHVMLSLREVFLVSSSLAGVALIYQMWFWKGEKARMASADVAIARLHTGMFTAVGGVPPARDPIHDAPLATSVGPDSTSLGTPGCAAGESSGEDDDADDR